MNALNGANLLSASYATKGGMTAGSEMATGMTLKSLKNELKELTSEELKATSVVETRGQGPNKTYVKLLIVKDDHQLPRCPHEKLPMNNDALLTMVGKLSAHYGKAADNKELAFLPGGFSPPGYCQATLMGTGLGLYFNTETGQPMGKLTGKL